MTKWENRRWGNECGTNHCRGGWAIYLAGKEGKNLKEKYEYEIAASLIYEAAYPHLPIPNFYTTNAVAKRDMKKRSRMEQGGIMSEDFKQEVEETKDRLIYEMRWWNLTSEEAYILQGVEHIFDAILEEGE